MERKGVKKHGIIWWVAVILFIPISIPIITVKWFVRREIGSLSKPIKLLIGIAFWIVLYLIILTIGSNKSVNTDNQEETIAVHSAEEQSETLTTIVNEVSLIDEFITKFNEKSSVPITDVMEFVVPDKESGHYRVEYRLNAYKNAIGKTGKLGSTSIDIVNYGSLSRPSFRIYADGINQDTAKNIISIAAPIMDSELSNTDILKVLQELEERELNGYLLGNLKVLLIGNNKENRDLMISTD